MFSSLGESHQNVSDTKNQLIDVESHKKDRVTAQAGTKILGDKKGRLLVVSEEWCYRKAETLEDAEEAARWWRYNLVR